MSNIATKLTYLNGTKQAIKQAINEDFEVINDNTTFREYADEISSNNVKYKDLIPKETKNATNTLDISNSSGLDKALVTQYGNTYQEGEPTPETPQDIHVVSGDNTIKVEGKNLLNKELIENGKATNDYGTPGAIPVVGTVLKRATLTPYNAIEAKPNTKYTFNMTSTTWRFAIAQMDTDKISLGDTGWQTTTPYTITTSANCRYIGFNFSKTDNTNISDEEFNIFINANLMMFEGESVIPYTPYTSQTYPINLGNINLCKIGNYKDRIYPLNGKWYLEKKIGKVVLYGSEEGWNVRQGSNPNLYIFYLLNNLVQNSIKDSENCLSNYFIVDNTSGLIQKDGGFRITEYSRINRIWLCVNSNIATTISNFKTWLSTHNTTAYYVLATPTTTEITENNYPTLYNQLNNIKLFEGVNHITMTNESGLDVEFDIEYYKDWKLD